MFQSNPRAQVQGGAVAGPAPAIVLADSQVRVRGWNTGAETLTGWTGSEMLGHHLVESLELLVPPAEAHRALVTALDTGTYGALVEVRHRDGSTRVAHLGLTAHRGQDGLLRSLVVVVDQRGSARTEPDRPPATAGDTTTPAAASRPVASSLRYAGIREALLTSLAASIAEGVLACDASGAVLLHNPAMRAMLGVSPLDSPAPAWSGHARVFAADGATPVAWEDLPPRPAARTGHRSEVTLLLAPRRGRARWVRAVSVPVEDAETGAAFAVYTDVTEEVQAWALLRSQALTDDETGLPNLRQLVELVEGHLRLGLTAGVARFTFSTTWAEDPHHGVPVEDDVLVAMADALAGLVGDSHVVGRVSPCTFAVLYRDTPDVSELQARCEGLVGALPTCVPTGDGVVPITIASCCVIGEPGANAHELLAPCRH